ncbi:hypothetical protein [Streptomyces syringium]|uniref:hypothetical protein n=1 Tax=Streptomyces syringium TaxID=76729 RepID=UPI0034564115
MHIVFCKWDRSMLRILLARGAAVHLVLDDYDWAHGPDPALLARAASVHRVRHFDSIDELSAVAVDLMLSGAPVEKVTGFTEFSQFGAGHLAHLLGLDSPSPRSAAATRDKRLMKLRAAEAGWRHARFRSLPTAGPTETDPLPLVAELGLPLVVKPVTGMGTLSTAKAESVDELRTLLAGRALAPELHSRQLLVEEFVAGREYHVDAVWRDAEPWFLCISRYLEPRLSLAGAGRRNGAVIVPRDDDPQLYAWVEERHRALNKVLGLGSGVTHLEMFRDPEGGGEPVFSEIASRPAGAFAPEALSAHLGVDFREVWAEELTGGSGESLGFGPPPHRYIGWLNLAPPTAGVLTELPDEEALRADPAILDWEFVHRTGDHVEPDHPSAWCVLLVVGAPTAAGFESAVERIERQYRCVVERKEER